jgi:hypothetical protein
VSTPAYNPTAAKDALRAAVDSLQTARKAAKAGADADVPGAAVARAVLDQAIEDVKARGRTLDAQLTARDWTLERARDALLGAELAGVELRTDGVVLPLPTGAMLRVTPAATPQDPAVGYRVEVLLQDGGVATRFRAVDDTELAASARSLARP